MTPISIPLHKGKLLRWFLMSGLFMVLGLWLAQKASSFEGSTAARAWFVAISCMLFAGAGMVVLGSKLFDKRPGLVLNDEGIHRLGVFAFQPVIPWKRITHCSITNVKGTKILLVHVDNVEEVLARMNPVSRAMQRLVLGQYGTPHSLTSNTLECDLADLKRTIENGAEAHTRPS